MRDFGISLPGDPEGDEDPFYKSKEEALRQDVMPSYKPTPAAFDGYGNISRTQSLFSSGGSSVPSAPATTGQPYDGYSNISRSMFGRVYESAPV